MASGEATIWMRSADYARPGTPGEAGPPSRLAREVGATACACAAALKDVHENNALMRHTRPMFHEVMREPEQRAAPGRLRTACVKMHDLHPTAWLPRAFWTIPATWEAPADGGVLGRACGYAWAWGLPPTSGADAEDFCNRAAVANVYTWQSMPERREMMASMPSAPPVPPEAQFAAELAKRSTATLRARAAASPFLRRVYTLRLSLCAAPGPGAPDVELQPPTWRRLQVRGDAAMRDVASLCAAAMGWAPDYHSYYWVDRRDGALLGDPACEAIDKACCAPLHSRWAVVDDAAVPLAAMLAAPSEKLTWLYDLGEGWQHTLEVEHMSAADEADATPRLLAGAGACPPEDNNGLPGAGGAASFAAVLRDMSGAAGRKQRGALLTAEELRYVVAGVEKACNYKRPRTGPRRAFRPLEALDLRAAAADVAHAAAAARAGGSHAHAGRLGINTFGPATRRDETGLLACRVCGGHAGGVALKRCGGCRGVFYCSQPCAAKDWAARHKAECATARACSDAARREGKAAAEAARGEPPEFAHAALLPNGKALLLVRRGDTFLSDSTQARIVRPAADRVCGAGSDSGFRSVGGWEGNNDHVQCNTPREGLKPGWARLRHACNRSSRVRPEPAGSGRIRAGQYRFRHRIWLSG